MDILNYLPELLSVTVIATFMAISPGADFVMITRNSLFFGRKFGVYSSFGIAAAIWVHVAYSIAGLALVISNSIVLFSVIKYLGAAYLIYIGYKTFTSKDKLNLEGKKEQNSLTRMAAFRLGFVTNVLNPKTSLFFLSIFTQVVSPTTPLGVQAVYGLIICLAHLLWFSLVSVFFSHPHFVSAFNRYKHRIEKVIGSLLIGFGLKVALISNR
ncbi:amino acid transporter [Aliidiomarina taiwanensis]|uniref:Amino acid transporter n=1 Tax=Aliidiomarina taiwanensis TaxID=946228 RepID=A0A432XAE3_9GAMM|nr:LysE family transporter [Aliidiomarina taiwanensis]RUO44290.1 amino acid transporter [Aliidiomarina taiwanensis]